MTVPLLRNSSVNILKNYYYALFVALSIILTDINHGSNLSFLKNLISDIYS
jgi:hypothetical protein